MLLSKPLDPVECSASWRNALNHMPNTLVNKEMEKPEKVNDEGRRKKGGFAAPCESKNKAESKIRNTKQILAFLSSF